MDVAEGDGAFDLFGGRREVFCCALIDGPELVDAAGGCAVLGSVRGREAEVSCVLSEGVLHPRGIKTGEMFQSIRLLTVTMIHQGCGIRLEARGYSTSRLFKPKLTDIHHQFCVTTFRHAIWMQLSWSRPVRTNCPGLTDTNMTAFQETVVVICRFGRCSRRMIVGH